MHTPSKNRYKNMIYNRCGNSGLKLPAVSMGLWHNFGSVDRYDNMVDIITRSFDLGITHFDLANNYGPYAGAAEENFGRILKNELAAYRDELVISTKAGYYMWEGPYGEWGSRKYLLASLDASLKRMGLAYVDIFYSHRFDPDTPLEETMGALDTAVRSGKALYAGISSYNSEQTKRAAAILRGLGTPCIIHQPSYSMMNRWVEDDGLDKTLKDEGIGCIAFSPLANGMLTERYLGGIPADSRLGKDGEYCKPQGVTDELLAKIGKLNDIAKQRGQKLAQMAVAWLLNRGVTSVLVGASKVQQIEDNAAAIGNIAFSQVELDAIDAVLK